MERPFINDVRSVLKDYVASPAVKSVESAHIQLAADLIKSVSPRRSPFVICRDLAADSRIEAESTHTLAVMFRERHTALPVHWRTDDGIMRTVLSMSAEIELGHLRARRLEDAYRGGNPATDKHIEDLTGLLSDLQKRE